VKRIRAGVVAVFALGFVVGVGNVLLAAQGGMMLGPCPSFPDALCWVPTQGVHPGTLIAVGAIHAIVFVAIFTAVVGGYRMLRRR
jgi:hypothetical protein